jgi:streptogrisin C
MIGPFIRRGGRLAAVASVSVVVLTAGAAMAAPAPTPLPAPRLTSDQENAALSLSRDYHLPLAEARTRIDRQTGIGRLAERLPGQLGDAYAGMFIDNAHEGRVVVLTTVPPLSDRQTQVSRLAQAQGLTTGLVELRAVKHDLRQLAAINQTVGDRLVELNRGAARACVEVDGDG